MGATSFQQHVDTKVMCRKVVQHTTHQIPSILFVPISSEKTEEPTLMLAETLVLNVLSEKFAIQCHSSLGVILQTRETRTDKEGRNRML